MWSAYEETGRGVRYLYCPYGPVLKNPGANGPLRESLQSLLQEGKDRGQDFVRLEPGTGLDAKMKDMGAIPSFDGQPQWTTVLDLARPAEELKHSFTKGHRSSINGAQRRGLTIRHSTSTEDLALFLSFLERASKKSRFHGHEQRYYETLIRTLGPAGIATIYLAEHEDTPVAAAICLDWAGVRYYAHAAADPEQPRSLAPAAPVCWQMILDAQKNGSHSFDLYGIAPPGASPTHPWAGFTQFKLAFGGRVVERGHGWDLPIRKLRHTVYRTMQKLRP